MRDAFLRSDKIALGVGLCSLALMLGALGFQYIGGIAPCEMCHWQRWPLIGAAVVGIAGGAFATSQRAERKHIVLLAVATLILVGISGLIGAYQAGVEWGFLPGPAACTGPAVLLTGSLDLNHAVVRCDIAAWRLFGISLAGYNAIISLATASAGAFLLARPARH
jgi:disulfide bond formation protein DsbB